MSTQDLVSRLESTIRLSFPVLVCDTFETSRAEDVFKDAAEKANKQFHMMPFKVNVNPKEIENIGKSGNKDNKQVVIIDSLFHERAKIDPTVLPGLKASLEVMQEQGITYVIIGSGTLKEEFVYNVNLPPISEDEMLEMLLRAEQNVKADGDMFTDAERQELVNYARGLSATQIKNVFIYSAYLRYKKKDHLEEVRREKAHILRDVGLEVMPTIDIADVGGLSNLKEFLFIRKAGWEKNLPVKGALLAGVPGGGKSLIAKATASVLGTSLVRLDMGKFYSKYIGETERQFSRALETIEQIAPVTVLIDEVEKYFGRTQGDHEVTQRLLGTFLTWLQERKDKIFIVATANRVHALPPELVRAGRWDKAFFIDLPSAEERHLIFTIHLKKHGADPAAFDMPELLRLSEAYTGAEIEQAVVDSMYLANAFDKRMDTEMLSEALKQITPTSETRRGDINQIRELRNQGFYPASEVFEDAPSGGRRVQL
jgi:ATP-dependent 26S proteasome regulatory subunit